MTFDPSQGGGRCCDLVPGGRGCDLVLGGGVVQGGGRCCLGGTFWPGGGRSVV